jgi:hypothetical protein
LKKIEPVSFDRKQTLKSDLVSPKNETTKMHDRSMDPFNEVEDIKTLETIANDYETLDKLKKDLSDK